MKKKTLLTLPLIALLSPSTALAQFNITQPDNAGIQVAPNASADSLTQTILGNFVTLLFTVAGIAIVAFILWGAFDWIISGAEKEKLAGARKKIVSAIIGFALLALAFVIITVVGTIVDFNPLADLEIPVLGQP